MNNLDSYEIIGLCIAAVMAIIAIYAIISLLMDYKQENSRVRISKLSTANDIDVDDACDYGWERPNYFESKRHFTDVGSSYLANDNSVARNYGDIQFVIVKSVIHTETREELNI